MTPTDRLTVPNRAAVAAAIEEGRAHHTAGRLQEAEAIYRRVLAADPNQPVALHLLGVIAHQMGKNDIAVDLITKALAIKPDYAEAHSNLGNVLKALGKLDEAVASYHKALAIKPDYAEAHNNLAVALLVEGKLDEAMASSRHALDLKPDYHVAHYNLGVALEELARVDEAVTQYRQALTIKPDYAAARSNLMLARKYQDGSKDAAARCRQALAENPYDAKTHLNMGITLWEQSKVEDAMAALCESLRIEPDSASAHYYLGLIHKTQGKRGEALACIRKSLVLDSGDIYALAAEASILAQNAHSKQRYRRKNVKRVALHMNQRYHYRILRPVFDALRDRHVSLLTPHLKELVDFDPDVIIVAESHASLLRARLPRALFVWVRHGLISKNVTCFSARVSDFACMTSEASREWYIQHGGRPRRGFWITGYVQMDPLFRNDPLPIAYASPADHKTVLYAPTWSQGLSSAPMLGERLVELIRGRRRDLSIIIKPHPVTGEHHPDWLLTWRALAEANADVDLIEDPAADVLPYLKAADLLISDASSVVFQYLAVDRPIILITNSERYTSFHFDPMGIEWRWRDVGEELHDVEDLAAAVERAIDDPRLGAERRAYYTRQLFGDLTDGHAADRIVEKISELDP